ncbi:MAG: DUF1223 domain-containing protein [Isosphaeraceae bacterium]|nr:DUF1223 domain-containing protein [Isosphaeraceae bacterium]
MRLRSFQFFVALALLVAAAPRALAADEKGKAPADLSGNWKLLLPLAPTIESEILLLGLKQEGGQLTGELKDALRGLPEKPKVESIERRGDKITIILKGGPLGEPFHGTLGQDGQIRGTIRINNNLIPGRLEKTDAEKLSQAQPDQTKFQAVLQKFLAANAERDPKAKVQKFRDLLGGKPDVSLAGLVYPSLLQAATAAELSEKDVRDLVSSWLDIARPYGEEYVADTQLKALKTLTGKKPYAALALDLAQTAEKDLGAEATTEQKAAAASALAAAAKLAGRADLATSAEARAEKLEAQLDEEYHQKVPPFKPETFAGRKEAKADRVVLMELFTGAQCPPCVAADVGFDGLLQSYKPTELVALQYHLHIPGPDPLTNEDTIARQNYYKAEITGTPTTLFNGKPQAAGGGPMSVAEGKYQQYRKIIDQALEDQKQATIDLNASRTGDEVRIKASAEAKGKEGDTLRLRLALVEEAVRYVGGNGLRFHHHVVRSMPGGPEGKALQGGKVTVEETVKLSDVRKALEQYLSDFEKDRGGFPNPLPPIQLNDLSVVAFVQDDADKSILHAVSVPLKGEKAGEKTP